MRVLVTGATGRVGSRFVPRLLDHGDEALLLVRDARRVDPLTALGANTIEGDLRDAACLRNALEGVDAVVHLAATTARGATDGELMAINRDAVAVLGRAAVVAGVRRFVFTSTLFVYGPGRGRPVREEDEPRPSSAYACAKAAAEAALAELHRVYGLGVRVLRLPLVYGEGDRHLAESMPRIRAWPAHRRQHMVHHADTGQALIRALHADGADGRIFNLADDAPVTAAELRRLHGEKVKDPDGARPLDDPWEGILDVTRIRAELGFRPVFPSVYTAVDAGAM